ncbi:ABC transporter substrate-binding protein [Allostreptomyces psammosilenae]|uniref:Multiple sugar transport system substrate-binding protein n=1 Tax=Allostreptomyces psammosilenae TaxID=1892865 RepID=A0A852ZLE9_9ACTN|nr:sugar ABC transporter substrate-binding protein [Allostreptomyces psammosilenae]NYI03206.1 multiple sugar transport system substrate-binding protein [Allostreptomyces psammosilenae]
MTSSRSGRRTVRRFTAATAVLAASTLLLTACGSGSGSDSADGTVEITFWDNNGGPGRTPLWEHMIAEFEKANPGITVNYVGVPIAQVQQKYDTAVAAGGLPDVGGVSTAYLSGLAIQEALEPLDERFEASPLRDELGANFVESVRAAAHDDQLYSIPTSANMGILWYRTDWYEEAGLEPPNTWDNFFTSVEELTDASQNRYGFTIRGGAGSIPQVLDEIYSMSGIPTVFDESGQATVNDPENVAALERIVDLYQTATPSADLNNDYTKMVAQFDGGSIGIMHHNLGSYQDHMNTLGPDKVTGIPLPVSDEGNHNITSNPVDGLGVFRTSEHKEEAWKFVEFVASKAMNSYWSQNVGQIPANTSVGEEPWVAENATLASALEAMNDPATNIVQLPYYLPEFNAITKTDMEPVFQSVLLGDVSAQEFLDQMAAALEEAQAGWLERQGG